VDVPRWAVRHRAGRHRAFVPSWAPSIGRATNGRWLIAYAAWPAGRVGSERRLHVATLKARKHGTLVVARRFRR
jgi:hypothetical protein